MDRTEEELVAAIRKVLSGEAPGVVVGVGDDAAVVEPGGHHGVLTTDLLVEGVHFERARTAAHDLGHRAIAVNVSDVAAMGGSPRFALTSLVLPEDTQAAWVMELYGGMREAADDYGLALVGGDTNRGEIAMLAVAVWGEVARGKAITRAGAHPGERLVVTGTLGASAGGLRLARGTTEEVKEALSTEAGRALVAAHERPVARVGEGQALAGAGATAMIDLSDGLALDLARVCRESGVGAEVRADRIPVAPALTALAPALGVDPLELALHGGEDHELLASLPADAVEGAVETLRERFGTTVTEVGEVVEGQGLHLVREDGTRAPLEPRGWDHFA